MSEADGEELSIIYLNIDKLYKIRNEHFDDNKQYIKKFNLRLNETNVIQLINDIEDNLRKLEKYKKFAEHIHSHSDKGMILDDWVVCKICNKTFKEIVEDEGGLK